MNEAIRTIAQANSIDIEALERADENTRKSLESYRGSLRRRFAISDYPYLDIVLTGSFGRREKTSDSDCDYLVLIDQTPSDPRLPNRVLQAMDEIGKLKNHGTPGRQGIFGDFVAPLDLISRIGLQSDTNINTTRRLTILTESVSVLNSQVRERALKSLLARYLADYAPENREGDDPPRLPRFLLNDLIRYWRTIAVDFGAKQWSALRPDWFLRYAKLITTRKLLFGGSLATVFMCRRIAAQAGTDFYGAMSSHLYGAFVNESPLERLFATYEHVGADTKVHMQKLLGAYNRFIEILDSDDGRNLLMVRNDQAAPEEADELASKVENEIATEIQDALVQLFVNDPLFTELTASCGLF